MDLARQNGQSIVLLATFSLICSAHARQIACPHLFRTARRYGASVRQTPQVRETSRDGLEIYLFLFFSVVGIF